MHYVKIKTSDGEVRWINLHLVSRVTLAEETPDGTPLLVIFFADHCPDVILKIRGTDEVNRAAIEAITSSLEVLAQPIPTRRRTVA